MSYTVVFISHRNTKPIVLQLRGKNVYIIHIIYIYLLFKTSKLNKILNSIHYIYEL